MALGAAGLAVSVYLTVEHYTASTTLACPETAVVNCRTVTTSEQSNLLGVPLPLLGLLYFAGMLALGLPVAWRSRSLALRRTRVVAAALGVVFVVYLVIVELFVVDAICLWCTAVHAFAVALFAVVAYGTAVTVDDRR
jgi:uncharacterized membrane protein